MSASNDGNWMAQQLAERAARLRQQQPVNQDNESKQSHANSDDLSDYELAKQLQAKYDAADNQQPKADEDNDVEMSSPPQNNQSVEQNINRSIDEDHEIALQLQRQFDNEQNNVPPPNTDPQPRQSPNVSPFGSFGPPPSSNHTHFSVSTTGPDGTTRTFSSSNGQIPPQFASFFGSQPAFNQNTNTNPNGSGFSSGFDHPFFRSTSSSSSNSMSDLFGAAFGGSSQPQAMNFNMMINNNFGQGMPMMMNDLTDLMQMLHPRPRVADQTVIEQNTATETYAAKKKKKDENKEEEDTSSDPSETCSICLEPFKEGEEVRRLPCLHIFHKPEIDKWLKTGNDKCPICRVPINGQIDNNHNQ